MDKRLSKYWPFWVYTITPVFVAIIIALVIGYYENLEWCGTAKCFNYFANLFKFPLGIAALAFPFSAWVIASHRSALTLKQIDVLEEQNRFSNYYKQREEFLKFLDKHKSKPAFSNPITLHLKLFGGIEEWDYHITPKVFETIEELIDRMISYYDELNKASEYSSDTLAKDALAYYQFEVNSFCEKFDFNSSIMMSTAYEDFQHNGFELKLVCPTYNAPLKQAIHLVHYLLEMMAFDEKFRGKLSKRIKAFEIMFYGEFRDEVRVNSTLPPKHDFYNLVGKLKEDEKYV